MICVPDAKFNDALGNFFKRPDTMKPVGPSQVVPVNAIEAWYPRFKIHDLALFFVVLDEKACHVKCTPENIEFRNRGFHTQSSTYMLKAFSTRTAQST